MKQIILSILAPVVIGGMFNSAYSQIEPAQPCCSIIAMDVKNNLAVARDNTTGRLYQFKADAMDMRSIRKGDAVTINGNKVSAIYGSARVYITVRPDPIQPCCNVVSIQVDGIDPCCNQVTIKNNSTNNNFSISVPKQIAATLKPGQAVAMDVSNNLAVVQSSYGGNGEMNSYGYSAISGDNMETTETEKNKKDIDGKSAKTTPDEREKADEKDSTAINAPVKKDWDLKNKIAAKPNTSETDKWVITADQKMKGVLGRLDINFPADVERSILIYQPADNKFITSVSRNDKIYTIAPGHYHFTLTNVPVDNVPIQKGHETRLKYGFLNVVSEGKWHLYNDTKEKAYTSGNKPIKLPLPVGSYQLKLGLDFYPFVIKDGETVEM